MNTKTGMLWVAALALGLGLLGCGTNIGNGMVQVELADAPDSQNDGMQALSASAHGAPSGLPDEGDDAMVEPDYEQVIVTLGAVQAHYRGDDGERWITLVDAGGTHDLTTLRNDITAVLGDQEIPAGVYSELRMIVTSGSVVIDGTSYPLMIPSAAQTGLKFPHRFEVEEGVDYVLVIDFDAVQSIEVLGPTGEYLLEPVLSVRAFGEQ